MRQSAFCSPWSCGQRRIGFREASCSVAAVSEWGYHRTRRPRKTTQQTRTRYRVQQQWRGENRLPSCSFSPQPDRIEECPIDRFWRHSDLIEVKDPKNYKQKPPRDRSQSVHYDLVVGQMFAKNSKQKLWLFVLYLFDPKFLKMAPGMHNVATNQINRSHCADCTRW
jgi:hypothetical protein